MIILSPALTIPSRQAIVTGRAFERFTQRGLEISKATLTYQFSATSGPVLAKFQGKPEGYFAMQLDPSSGFPDVSGAGTVRLELTLQLANGTTEILGVDVPEADLTLADYTQQIAGQDTNVRHLPGAPIRLNFIRAPFAVALEGQVLLNGNPATPGAALTVTVGAQGPIITDSDGRFRTGLLPISATVAVSISFGGDINNFTHHLDFSTPLNRALYAFIPDDN